VAPNFPITFDFDWQHRVGHAVLNMLGTEGWRVQQVQRRDVLLSMIGGLLVGDFPAGALAAERVIISKMALIDGRAVLALKIGEAGPYLFMIDTGGHLSLIDDALARSLRLEQTGMTRSIGVGGVAVLPLYLARNVVFGGGATQPFVAFAGMARGFTGDVRGTLAAGMLTAVESDLDFEKGEWRAYPDGRPERIGFVRLSNAIAGGEHGESPRLFGEAEVNGRHFRFLLDTGAPGGVSLGTRAARALGLWDDSKPFAPQQTRGIGGIGGLGRIVRAQSLSFGARTFERPLVLLRAKEDAGGADVDGILGLDVLRQFNLSTDPHARSLWVKSYAAAPSDERYGLSGLWLDPAPDGARVAIVGTGSPGAAAGIRAGDRIIGEPFSALVAKITAPAGTRVALTVNRGGQAQPVTFTLSPYL
jgi:hypothetical protein